ncbi:hypothetical protein RvY_07198-2 [Ramazzottius varieornatus]|uniref:Protein kinase domain-containing protein n=1 Tax=Ramazzottius varieornatus TaxID=947166 RepID=A0A1D1V7F5_RAMVA|nr:hypothetical protein RvY_07198-2 [Ramazzottius varieornatus]
MQSRNTADKQLTAAMGKLVLRATSSLDEPTENSSRIVLSAAADNVTADFVFESPRIAKKTNVDPELAGSSEVHVDKLMRKPSSRRTIRRRTLKISRETDGRQFRLEQFNWLKTVGTGTFGRVVLCEDSAVKDDTTPKYFAMKILRIRDVLRLKQVEHINNEKSILERLNHPFIVNLFWTKHDTSNLYMLLEYAPGGELFSYLRSVRRFSSGTAMFYAAEIILALEYLHERSIVYRDLKPENLLLDAEGHIKVTDFGFAKEINERIAYTLCGTPDYLAPEIILGRGYNKGVDYWAFGILCYEMLVGHPPFFSDNPMGIYEKILDGLVRWPKTMDLVAKDLIKKLLAGDRTKRLGCMKEGVGEIKSHKWFRPINWTSCYERKLEPPYVPKVSHPGDARNFDDYPEDWSDTDSSVTEDQLAIFQDF